MADITVPIGRKLPFTPDFAGNLRFRYDFPWNGFAADAYARLGIAYTGDARAGFVGDAYNAEDITALTFGNGTNLKIVEEGGFFGTPLTASPCSERKVGKLLWNKA